MLLFRVALALQLVTALSGDDFPDTHGILLEDRRVEIPHLPPNAVVFNPSLARVGEYLVMAFRCDRNDLGWGPHMNIGLAVLDDNLMVRGEPQLFDFSRDTMGMSTAEDPRLVVVDEQLYLTFNAMIDHPLAGRRGINIAQVDVGLNDLEIPTFTVPHTTRLVFQPDGQTHWIEKNWAPFAYDHAVHFVYTTNPPHVIRLAPDKLAQWPEELVAEEVSRLHEATPYDFGDMRGGSQAQSDEAFGGDYFAFFHGREMHDHGRGWRLFLHIGFYTFAPSPPFAITRMLPYPLTIPNLNERNRHDLEVAYPGGAAWHHGQLWVAYGHMDDSVHLLHVDVDKLLAHSVPATRPDQNKL